MIAIGMRTTRAEEAHWTKQREIHTERSRPCSVFSLTFRSLVVVYANLGSDMILVITLVAKRRMQVTAG